MSNTKEVPLLVPSDFHSSLPKVPPFATNKQVVTSPLGTLVLPNGSNMTIQVGSVKNKKIDVVTLDKSSIWLDSGTFSSLQESSNIISSLQKRNGELIGSPESTALKKGWISHDQLSQQVSLNRNSAYFQNLANLLDAT